MGTGSAMVMRIVTKFESADAFVAAFSRYCTTTSCFVPGVHAKVLGGDAGFSMRLANGTEVLRGVCTVLASWADDVNPYGRPGAQLGIHTITPATRPLFDRLCRAAETDDFAPPTVEMPMQFPRVELLQESESGAIPEPIVDPDSALNQKTAPIASPATLLSLVAGRRTDEMEPIQPLPEHDPTTKTERPPVMTLLGVAPITRVHRSSAPRIAMQALSPTATPPQPLPALTIPDERPTAALAPARPRRSMWSRVFGRLSALLRRVRWAYRRRRGVRATLRRLPTRT